MQCFLKRSKAWDLSTGTLLSTFQFPRPISCLAWDVTERLFFAASSDGSIHQVNLFKQRDDKLSRIMEAVGGGGSTDVIRMTDEDQEAAKRRLISVGYVLRCHCACRLLLNPSSRSQAVTTIVISLTSSLLLAGTVDGFIHTYDIASHQLLRSISTHKGFPITHLMTMLKPPDLVGHVSLTLSANPNDTKESIPVRPVASFHRVKDPKQREAHEVTMMLPPSTNVSSHFLDHVCGMLTVVASSEHQKLSSHTPMKRCCETIQYLLKMLELIRSNQAYRCKPVSLNSKGKYKG